MTTQTTNYSVSISESYNEPGWDAFLETAPGGDHVQTCLWAQVKASLDWRSVRLVVRCEGVIVAGAQILMRQAPVVGTIGYVSKGPVLAFDDPVLVELTVNELLKLTRSYSIQHLSVQPPLAYEKLLAALKEKGFRSSFIKLAPTATTQLDLSKDLDEILANMKASTRQNVNRSEREGITVRSGASEDLGTYYRLLRATSSRKRFAIFPRHYYETMWHVLSPHGFLHLLVAEFEGEVISALMLVTFGDVAINKLGVWSGQHGKKRPNEAIHWAAIKLAKSLGHKYYDLGGIKVAAAEAILRGEPIPDSARQTVTSFKLEFGGEAFLFPRAFDYLPNPVYRWAFTELYPRVQKYKSIKRTINKLRTR